MQKRSQKFLALAVVLTCLSGLAYAQWTDGQNAAYVVGQSNFTNTSQAVSQNGFVSPY